MARRPSAWFIPWFSPYPRPNKLPELILVRSGPFSWVQPVRANGRAVNYHVWGCSQFQAIGGREVTRGRNCISICIHDDWFSCIALKPCMRKGGRHRKQEINSRCRASAWSSWTRIAVKFCTFHVDRTPSKKMPQHELQPCNASGLVSKVNVNMHRIFQVPGKLCCSSDSPLQASLHLQLLSQRCSKRRLRSQVRGFERHDN